MQLTGYSDTRRTDANNLPIVQAEFLARPSQAVGSPGGPLRLNEQIRIIAEQIQAHNG